MSAANGTLDFGLPFYEAICDGKEEATLMKAQVDASRASQAGGQ